MSAGTSKGALNDGTRELLLRWEQVRESWRDGNADAFGRDYLDGLGDGHFDAVAENLVATLKELNVPQELIDEVVALVSGTRDDVLNR